ncbi:hypothetical protein DEI81_13765 [Curtobacterium sp. MCBD17_013]|uniref:acyltransferase family protein n=1 Tax=Curtobacterium sp. MCBD17_013 TaxID=2175668 RepID=UPI000DA97954|nr:acyltransferase [Curtobacterium sp. MCBD17_013]PZF59453.1 hypothetical protein DEI81_13765 [Curtobacterium sp. MCBD17_013]
MSEGSAALDYGHDRAGHRLLPLDGLRGLAAIGVVLFHYLSNASRMYPQLGERIGWAHAGQQGVRVFFIISGIVIMMSLRGSTPAKFARSRFVRLYPSYWVAIVITATVVAVVGLPGQQASPRDLILNFTMIQSAFGVQNVDGAYWTLSVELVFYVIAAVLWFSGLLTERRFPLTLYVWLAASFLLALASQALGLQGFGGVFQNLPWFLVGIIALRIVEGDRRPSVIMLPAVAFLAGLYFDWASVIGAAVGFTIVLVTLMWRPLGLASRPMRALGWASYPLYLLHQNLGYILLLHLHAAGVPRWVAVCIAILFALALAFAFTKWVDVPLRSVVRSAISPRKRARATA